MTRINRRFMDALRVVRCLGADFSVLKWMGQASSFTVLANGEELEFGFRNVNPREEVVYYFRRIEDALNGFTSWNSYSLWRYGTQLGVAAAVVNHFLVTNDEVAMWEDRL